MTLQRSLIQGDALILELHVRCLETVNNILPNGGGKMVMNRKVKSHLNPSHEGMFSSPESQALWRKGDFPNWLFHRDPYSSWWFQPSHLKNISQIGSFPQVGVKIKNL